MKTINKLNKILITIALGFALVGSVSADDSGDNSFYKEDGSLVIIRGAEDSGIMLIRLFKTLARLITL